LEEKLDLVLFLAGSDYNLVRYLQAPETRVQLSVLQEYGFSRWLKRYASSTGDQELGKRTGG
jgi:hypothetical protein